jgi:hypothetical protein
MGLKPSMQPIRPEQLALLQGGYFLFTGIWPLVSRRTFEAVTGPKKDFWLAQTVGVLVASVGGTLVLASKRGRVGQEASWLAASSAAGLAAIDILYAARGRISKVYLADAAIEATLVSAWIGLRPGNQGLPNGSVKA